MQNGCWRLNSGALVEADRTFVKQALFMQQMKDDDIPRNQRARKNRGIKRSRSVEGVTCLFCDLFYTLCLSNLVELSHRFCNSSIAGTSCSARILESTFT